MSKQKIGAREAVNDIRSGMSDADLMQKYGLSEKGLDSLFKKLVEAKLLEESFLSKRSAAARSDRGTKPGAPSPRAPEPSAADSRVPPELLEAIAEDMKLGMHDAEIMRRHEMSPGKLNEIKTKLVHSGYLAGAQIAAPEAATTKICPFCSQQVRESQAKCPHCGQWLDPGARPSDEGGGPALTGSRPEIPRRDFPSKEDDFEEDKECPWEDRESYGTLNGYFQTATRCLLTPSAFFSKLPLRDGYLNPILFAAFTGVVSFVVVYLFVSLFGGRIGLLGLLLGMSFIFVGSLIFVPIGIGIWSGILHVVLYLLGGAKEGYQATFRVVSYSSVTGLFNAIPVVGTLASLWGLVLTVIGLRETHKTTTGKSVAAVLIPVGVVVLFAIIIVVITGIKIASQMSSALGKQQSARPVISQSYTDWNLPPEICSAIDVYIDRVDVARDLDAKSAQAKVDEAMRELDQVLNQFQDHSHISEVRAKALAFGFSQLAQGQLGQKLGGKLDKLRPPGGWDALKDDLRRMCGK